MKIVLKIYKIAVSSALRVLLGDGCRFQPTCSEYATEAIERFGFKKGIVLTMKRLSKCHPYQQGYYDPLPSK